jgi:hypothetical protein
LLASQQQIALFALGQAHGLLTQLSPLGVPRESMGHSNTVIARNEAIHRPLLRRHGLPRRCAPRNDGFGEAPSDGGLSCMPRDDELSCVPRGDRTRRQRNRFVIARHEAIHGPYVRRHGLPRRCAPRNDGFGEAPSDGGLSCAPRNGGLSCAPRDDGAVRDCTAASSSRGTKRSIGRSRDCHGPPRRSRAAIMRPLLNP